MIDTQAIRKKILDLALRGKMTEQLPEDGTAKVLYHQIQDEKEMLIKAGKIKKEKSLPEISAEDTLADIPNTWIIVKLGSIAEIDGGTTPKPHEISEKGKIPYYKVSDMNAPGNETIMVNTVLYVNDNYRGKVFPAGTVIFPKNGGAALTNKRRILTTDSAIDLNTAGCYPYISELIEWVILYFKTIDFGKFNTGSTIPTISTSKIKNLCIPIPPLAEQHRIVDKIDAVFSLLDTIDTLQSQYQDNLTTLKSKIIDAGIQGKLTEQLPEDGTAEELYQQIQQEKLALEKVGKIKKSKLLPPISDEDRTFDIPVNWKWVRFDTISNILGTGMIRTGNEQYKEAKYYYFKMNNIGNFDGKCHFENMVMVNASKEEFDKYKLEENDFLFNTRNSKELVGKTAVVPHISKSIILNNNILKIQFLNGIVPRYINFYFLSTQGHAKLSSFVTSTTNVAAIYQRQLIMFSVPLPPLAEQKRIVAKLEELLPLCEG